MWEGTLTILLSGGVEAAWCVCVGGGGGGGKEGSGKDIVCV